jgi:hypothetical protein
MDEVGLQEEIKQSVSAVSSCKVVRVWPISDCSKVPPNGTEQKEDCP